ncbi:MAG: DNA polymerase III subunit alpha [Acidobacteria bacterium]|nr:DNA polymerase III subunit alpha [Acidobacteriota bacterium]
MSAPKFVHLHNHTDYSLLDGACHISKMMKLAAKNEWPAIAITDHGNLFGAVEFHNAAKKNGVKPIIGCEVYVARGDHKEKSEQGGYNHLLLLCKDETGYRNLMKLVSTGYLDGFYYKPRIDKDLLAKHSEGLICTSACLAGDVAKAFVEKEDYEEARRLTYEYADIFGKENFFLEIQDHGLDLDKKLIPGLHRLSAETGIPLVATNDAHYLTKEDAPAHEALLCVQTGKTLSDPNRMRFETTEFYLKTRDELLQILGGSEAPLNRTWEIAERCNLGIKPVANPFPEFVTPQEHSIDSYFEYAARQGLEKRRPWLEVRQQRGELRYPIEQYYERLDHEIRTIQQMKFPGYFLIVWDFIRYAKSKNIPVGPGRGSAAGSLVAWCLEITDIDPLQYSLLFERFLNPERISMPDIDIDFCMNRRGEVIQYVTEKYGREQVAQIITFNTMATKAAIKDVGRVMDMSFGDVDRLTKMVPPVLNIKLDDAIEQEPKLRDAMRTDPQVNKLIEVARRLEGVARNPSVHAAGVVIAPEPLRNLVPLYKTNKDEIVTQYDMKGLDYLGLLKMDFLGLTTLTVLDDALRWIKKIEKLDLSLQDLPVDDKPTFELLAKGLTAGVFQFESGGMRDILIRYIPERLEDLCALNALYRPGPIQGGMVTDFIERKHGRKPVTYLFPQLKPILEETYGVILYQEQVMQIANVIAGYSLGEADVLRRAMGKKKAELMAEHEAKFLKGAEERNFDLKKAKKLYDLMAQFAGYGFNKSHSAAYGFVAYCTAYLKAHYPVAFMAALLSSESGNTEKVVRYINECKDMDIEILPPDVNSSYFDFTPSGKKAISFGLGAIKNVGRGAVEAVIEARERLGRGFESLFDFCEEVDWQKINKRMLESSIKAGALDSLGGHRAQLIAGLDRAIENGQKAARDRAVGQGGLFAMMPAEEESADEQLPDAPLMPERAKLAAEKEMLGFYVTGHPLKEYRDKIDELATADSSNLGEKEPGASVALCGLLTAINRRRNREGRPWASAVLEDLKGSTELLIFANQYEQIGGDLQDDLPVLLRGKVRADEASAPKVSVEEIVALDNAAVKVPAAISITVRLGNGFDEPATAARQLRELFESKPGDTDVRLRLLRRKEYLVSYDLADRVRADRSFRRAAEKIFGEGSLEVTANG